MFVFDDFLPIFRLTYIIIMILYNCIIFFAERIVAFMNNVGMNVYDPAPRFGSKQ